MPRLIVSPDAAKRIIRRRRRLGLDRKDEVWDGVYVMAPDPNTHHQLLVGRLTYALTAALGDRQDIQVLPGGNVSDQEFNWTKSYRCPDVLVVLPGCSAEDRGSHLFGGPDFAVEIVSPGDRSRHSPLGFWLAVELARVLSVLR